MKQQLRDEGEWRVVRSSRSDPWDTLLEVLRDKLRLMKTKEGCSLGECCSCAVIMNKKAVNSCLVLAVDCRWQGHPDRRGFSRRRGIPAVQ